MTVWMVGSTQGEPKVFRFGACATAFYNADREHRFAPMDVEPKDAMTILNCHTEAA